MAEQPPVGPRGGPPHLDNPRAQQIPADLLQRTIERRLGSPDDARQNDPGWQPPYDPLSTTSRDRTRLIYRELPLPTIATNWSVNGVRQALSDHIQGIFESSGQLCDAILGDDRVQATMGSRLASLFGSEVRFKAADESDAARECLEAWRSDWPKISSGYALPQMQRYSVFAGWQPAQLMWDTGGERWIPHLRHWHFRYTYYHWGLFKYVALSQDGQIPIIPGDGKWVLHAPYGDYRGWMYGAVRAVAEPWLIRHFAYRDWARYSEVHGMPIRKAIVPAASSEQDRDRFQSQVAALGQETTIMVPTGVDETNKYDLQLMEPKDKSWDAFAGLIDRCDMSIVLAILFQNLTTEVKGGSYAATTAHMDIRESGAEADNEAWMTTIREQIARPYAWLNFGDASLAPVTYWDVKSERKYVEQAKQLLQFGTAVEVLRRGGVEFRDEEELRRYAAEQFGLGLLPAFKFTEPVSGGLGGGK